jgi:uncharacterized protein YqgV (UPF0045/DUF77 family)
VCGVSAEELTNYGAVNQKVPAFKFDIEATLDEVLALMKRLHIVAIDRCLRDATVVVCENE